ncbi:hypothetical protein GCM10010520_11380 [Rhizobium viscosum]
MSDSSASDEIGGNKLSRLLGEVQGDRARLGNDNAVIIDHRYLSEGADLAEGQAVEFTGGKIEHGIDRV